MIITCDNCHTRFELDESLVKETGSKVRCTHCDHVFVAHPPSLPEKQFDPSLGGVLPDEDEPELVLQMESDHDPELVLQMESDDEPALALEVESSSPSPVKDSSFPADEDGLDLSDIEKLLEMDDAGEMDEKESDAEPELELSGQSEKKSGSEMEARFDGADELDLSDIEKMLEMDDGTEVTPGDFEEEELKLEIEGEPEKTAATFEAESDREEIPMDFELSPDEDLKLELEEPLDLSLDLDEDDVEIEAAATPVSGKAAAAFPDIDLDESEGDQPAVKKIERRPEPVRKIQSQAERFGMGDEKAAEDEKKPPAKPSPAFVTSLPLPRKSKTLPILIMVVLLIIAGGGFGAYYLNQKGKLSLPGFSFSGKPGEITPVEETFKHQIIVNHKSGNLFVITGIVENAYNHPRSSIQVTGELAKGGNTIQTQTVFCGNVISETDLAGADMAVISSRLSNPTGDNQSNMNIRPGGRVPFMIVFANYPGDMEEYRIQVAGSSPSEK